MYDNESGQGVFTVLRYRDPAIAIAWLERVLGMSVDLIVLDEGGAIAHAQVSHDGGAILVESATSGVEARFEVDVGPAWVYLVVDAVEPHFARAVGEGAQVVEPVRNEDHGGRGYTVSDPEGNLWSVGSYRPETPPAGGL